MSVANTFYTTAGFNFDRSFSDVAQRALGISVAQLDFTHGAEAVEIINSMVKHTTNDVNGTERIFTRSVPHTTQVVNISHSLIYAYMHSTSRFPRK